MATAEDADLEILFNRHYKEIERLLELLRKRWTLKADPSLDYDDIKQNILQHIYAKLREGKYEKEKGNFGPWVNRMIHNQFKNQVRNHYGHFSPPCAGCEYNEGENLCSFTRSGFKSNECKAYKDWSKNKKNKYNVKLPVSFENHDLEVTHDDENLLEKKEQLKWSVEQTKKVFCDIQHKLTQFEKKVYFYSLIENQQDKDVAANIYKDDGSVRPYRGYRDIRIFKRRIVLVAKNHYKTITKEEREELRGYKERHKAYQKEQEFLAKELIKHDAT